jgi:hypothetical protein
MISNGPPVASLQQCWVSNDGLWATDYLSSQDDI